MRYIIASIQRGVSLGLSLTLIACNTTPPPPDQAQTSPTATPTSPSPSATPSASPSPSPTPVAAIRIPLTEEKLRNAEYFFLAKGSIKLTNGTYTDPASNRVYKMGDVFAYGDIDKDGIKDAVGSLQVTIPNTGDFSYLVAVVNDAGNPKNVSAEFMGAQIKVKTMKVNPDTSIEVVADQYQAGDPACCPSLKITRTYRLKLNPSPSPSPSATVSPVPPPASPSPSSP